MHQLEQEQVHLVTTELVWIEVADSLSAASIRSRTVVFVEGLRQLPILRIIPAQKPLLTDAWSLYSQRADKDWGLTDCSSFVVMTQEKIVRAFTSDHHFQQAGFTALMSPA
jgi:predicted nucleic acid-binding protein